MKDLMIKIILWLYKLAMLIMNAVFTLQMAVIGVPVISAAIVRLYENNTSFSSAVNKILLSSASNPGNVGNISAIAVVIWTASFALITLYIQGLEKKELGIPVVDIIKVRVGGLFWFHLAVGVFALEMGFLLLVVIRDSMPVTMLLTFVQVYNLVTVYWNLIIMTTIVHVKKTIDREGEKFLNGLSTSYTGEDLKRDWSKLLLYKMLRGIDMRDNYLKEEAIRCIIFFLIKAETIRRNGNDQDDNNAYSAYVKNVNKVVSYIVSSVYESHPKDVAVRDFIQELFYRMRRRSLNDKGEEVQDVFSNGWRIVICNLLKEQDEYDFVTDLVIGQIPGISTSDDEVETRKTWLGFVVNESSRIYKGKTAEKILVELNTKKTDCRTKHIQWADCCKSL